MIALKREVFEEYLDQLFSTSISELNIYAIGQSLDPDKALKEYGYGTPLRIDFKVRGNKKSLVFNTVRPGGFGHENMPDRAAILLWEAQAFNTLPQHVKVVNVGAFTKSDSMRSLSEVKELFLLTEYVEGTVYREDLDKIKRKEEITELDLNRVRAMAKYLASIHALKKEDPGYYERRNRELIGHNECILGLTDSYPKDHEWIKPSMLLSIEKKCIEWKWKNKYKVHRLSRVHGDFHPFNVLFREGTDFTVLDRSRGEYGEPADDIAAMSINYIFWSLMHKGEFNQPFKTLWDTFFSTYLEDSHDNELLEVIPPYLCWRALVVGSPVWYRIDENVRKSLISFAYNILEEERLNWKNINHLLEAPIW